MTKITGGAFEGSDSVLLRYEVLKAHARVASGQGGLTSAARRPTFGA